MPEPLTADLEKGREFRVAPAATACGRATARIASTPLFDALPLLDTTVILSSDCVMLS